MVRSIKCSYALLITSSLTAYAFTSEEAEEVFRNPSKTAHLLPPYTITNDAEIKFFAGAGFDPDKYALAAQHYNAGVGMISVRALPVRIRADGRTPEWQLYERNRVVSKGR